uniref:Uncharacterized protein n=3 Tax=Chrysotila carterae TaxID=13221 RepID=A0A7S4F6E6_CHRCT
MMAPGLPEALCFAFRTDNSGPPANDEAVAAVFAIVREQFPKAKVLASTLGDFVAAVQPYMSSLDLVTSEVGDTWIQGVQSDPLKMATYREIARGLVSCIELGACDRHDKTVLNASRFLLKAPEHTWGLPGANDSTHWNNSDFGAAYEHDSAVPPQSPQRFNYRDLNEGWQEHRLFNDFALSALRPHASDVHDTIAARLAQLRPRARDAPSHASLTKAGYAPVTKSERARGLFSAAPSAPRISCGDASFTISEHGALSSLRLGGREWAAETSPIGLLQYATYAEDDFDEMNAVYKGPFGARCGYGKPRMRDFAPDAKREDFVPTIGQIYLRHSNANTSASANAKSHAPFASSSTAAGGCSVVAELRFASRAVRAYGAPQSVWLNISVVDGRSNLDVRLTMFNKTRTRLPEAMHWSFYPQTPQPFSDSAGEAIADTEADAVKNNYPVKYNYTMDKLGSRISPFETCVNGNPRQHAVWKGVYFGPETVKSPTQPHGTAFARQGRADETGLPILPILPSRSTVQPFSAAMELAEVPQVSKVPKAAEARGSSSPGAPRASAGPTLRFSSLDAAVAAVADAEQPPTPFLKDLNPLSRPLTGVGYNLWNNIWNTNYPLYYPFEPSGDENLLFRFEIALEA